MINEHIKFVVGVVSTTGTANDRRWSNGMEHVGSGLIIGDFRADIGRNDGCIGSNMMDT